VREGAISPTVRAIAPALAELAGVWGIPCGEGEIVSVARYADLLLEWSQKINLTGASSVEVLVAEHLPDSFAVASVLGGGEDLVDVGSGGGLPALPLMLLRSKLRVTLVEPVAKKAAFLRTAVRELAPGGRVLVEARRAEAIAATGRLFDAATARAVLPPEAWARLGMRLVHPGGRVLVLSSSEVRFESPGLRLASSRSYLGGRRWLTVFVRQA
jgi:16S rRNA (guanine527-N7)-methyltransferase